MVEEAFAEINLLVLEGDAAGLAAKVAELTSQARERWTASNRWLAAASATRNRAVEAPVPLIHSGDA